MSSMGLNPLGIDIDYACVWYVVPTVLKLDSPDLDMKQSILCESLDFLVSLVILVRLGAFELSWFVRVMTSQDFFFKPF